MTRIVSEPSASLYWREVSACSSAAHTLGSLIFNAIPFAENDRPTALRQFARNWTGLGPQISQLKKSIGNRLTERTLADRSAEVFAIQATIDNYMQLPSEGIFDNVILQSNVTAQTLMGYLALDETPADYYDVANGLLNALTSLRAVVFFLFDRPQKEIYAAVCADIAGSLINRTRGIESARTVGRNRVSDVDEELTLVDELGPVWGTIFTIRVDDRVVYHDTFSGPRGIPRRGLNEVRQQARSMQESLAASNADAASVAVKTAYAAADGVSSVVC
jgi:hypothetical protein